MAALCDADNENVMRASEKYDVPALEIDEILADDQIQAVAIATPAVTHFEIARQALLAGKHVFVEKPMSMNIADAELLCEISEQNNLTLMVGHLLQYHPAFQKLKKLCSDGELGRVRYVYSNRLNLGQFRNEENILWSFAPHDISMILEIIGERPTQVTSFGHAFLNPDLHDMTFTSIAFESDVAAHTYVSWLHPFKEQRFVVIGEDAMAVFDDGLEWDQKLAIYNHNVSWQYNPTINFKGEPQFVQIDQAEPLKLECAHFIESVVNGHQPKTDGREGLRVLEVLSQAQQSLGVDAKGGMHLSAHQQKTGGLVHETAVLDEGCVIGEGTRIWHFSHILKNARIGKNCTIGQNVMIGPDVQIGNACKIQNNVSVYPGVTLEDGVFCGPSMVFTNVINPRAEIERKSEFKSTLVKRGATIGANATIVCGVEIGRYAFIGAGAVVTHDVEDYALIVGNPGHQAGYVCACGVKLPEGGWKDTTCSKCSSRYERHSSGIRKLADEK